MLELKTMASPARIPLKATQAPLMQPGQVVRELAQILGRKLTAYVGGAKDTVAVDRWISGDSPDTESGERLRLGFEVARILQSRESAPLIQAWMTGLNPGLGDRSPIRLLREESPADSRVRLIRAAQAFAARG